MMNEPTSAGQSPTRLFLIRHGQAHSNVDPVIAGMRGDRGLTELGVRQAHRLRDRLAASGEIRADVVIASTLPRARQTAEILAPALDRPIVFDDEVQEMRSGAEADGLPLAEYKRRFGWVDLEAEPLRPIDPGGESWATFLLRVATALDRIAREHAGQTIAVITHGGVIDGSFVHFFGLNGFRVPEAGFFTHNTSITEWERVPRRGQMRWRLVRYNDDTHLHGFERPEWLDWSAIEAAPAAAEEAPPVPLPTEPDPAAP
jgi:probable phosphoglycerate mutase